LPLLIFSVFAERRCWGQGTQGGRAGDAETAAFMSKYVTDDEGKQLPDQRSQPTSLVEVFVFTSALGTRNFQRCDAISPEALRDRASALFLPAQHERGSKAPMR
jgi:hypothetical protein